MGTKLDKLMVDLQMELSLGSFGLNLIEYSNLQRHIQEYATECVKASLEKASDNAAQKWILFSENGENGLVIDKESITSINNIVLL